MKWTEALVVDALRRIYEIGDGTTGSPWSMLTQVPVLGRRLDAVLQRASVERVLDRIIAVEIKVTRADFLSETDEKRAAAEQVAHECYYVTPPDLVPPGTLLPLRWGLIEVDDRAGALIRKPSTENPDPWLAPLLASVLARASADAEAIRRADNPTTEMVALVRRVESLSGQVERAHAARLRERGRHRLAVSQMLATDGYQDCADCDAAVYWSPTQAAWVHRGDGTQEEKCRKARAEAARKAQERRTGSRYLSGHAGPVIPKALLAIEPCD